MRERAFDYLQRALLGGRLSIVAVSLGGAAAILADLPIQAEAMLLEAVFASLHRAVENRLAIRMGDAAGRLSRTNVPETSPRV